METPLLLSILILLISLIISFIIFINDYKDFKNRFKNFVDSITLHINHNTNVVDRTFTSLGKVIDITEKVNDSVGEVCKFNEILLHQNNNLKTELKNKEDNEE